MVGETGIIRCKRTGKGLAMNLDGGWCICKNLNDCCLFETEDKMEEKPEDKPKTTKPVINPK